ncbi:MAG: hypothetical protein ACI81G_000800 [Gammaproteobacteria bacterium]|jgi:hypothetical protein
MIDQRTIRNKQYLREVITAKTVSGEQKKRTIRCTLKTVNFSMHQTY